MAKDLRYLSRLVWEDCGGSPGRQWDEALFRSRCTEAYRLTQLLEKKILLHLGTSAGKKHKTYQRHYQSSIFALMDRLYKMAQKKILADLLRHARRHTGASLLEALATLPVPPEGISSHTAPTTEDLARYIHSNLLVLVCNLSPYFSFTHYCQIPLPACIRQLYPRVLNMQLALILSRLRTTSVQPQYIDGIQQAIEHTIRDQGAHLTCYQYCYLESLRHNLDLFYPPKNETAANNALLRLLLRLNCNAEGITALIIYNLRRQLQSAPRTELRKRLLIRMKKNISQAPCEDMAFHPTHTSLHQQLSGWIAEELTYLELQQQQDTAEAPANNLRTTLTVSQLALFLRILIDEGHLVHHNHLDFLRTITALVRSRSNEPISHGSLRSKFYAPDRHTADHLRELLLQLAHKTKSYPA